MSTIEFRNSQEAFIHRNIREILEKDGHETADATKAANFAVETYRSSATFGGRRRGQVFRVLPRQSKAVCYPSQKENRKNQAFAG